MVCAHDVLARQLVESLGEALRQSAAVREHDRRPVLPDQIEDPRVDRGPDGSACLGSGGWAAGLFLEWQWLAEAAHVLDRNDHLQLEGLAGAGVDDGHLPARPDASQEAGNGLQGALCCRQSDALRRFLGEVLQSFEAQREMRAALAPGDRVHLVDDDVFDAAQHLPRGAGEQQIQGFGRGDQDVRRLARQLTALFLGRVTRPAGNSDYGRCQAQAGRGELDAGQGRPEVPLDVVGQCLEWRDVQDAHRRGRFPGRRRSRFARQAVQAPQERRQGLAAAGGSVDQCVMARRNGRPTLRLGRCRRREG